MGTSKTGVVLFVSVFYIALSLFMGFAVADIPSMGDVTSDEQSALLVTTGNTQGLELSGGVGEKANFFTNIVTGYKNLPVWINAIIFSPLAILFTWVLVTTFIPTVNGGN